MLRILHQVWLGDQGPVKRFAGFEWTSRRHRGTGGLPSLAGEVGELGVLGAAAVLDVGEGGDGVVAMGGSLPSDVVTDVVHPLHGNGVPGRVWSQANVAGVPPGVPVTLDHRADLAVEETVGQRDEKPLERQENIPDDDEDGGRGRAGVVGPHNGDQVGDAQQRNDDDQSLGCAQVDVLSVVLGLVRSQFGDDDLQITHSRGWNNHQIIF